MPAQLPIDFTPGLLEQFEGVTDVVRAVHTNCGKRAKVVAADMDLSPSELSRRVADDPKDLPFRLRDLERFVESTGDTRPIQYLALKYLCGDTSTERALQDLAKIAPVFIELATKAGLMPTKARR